MDQKTCKEIRECLLLLREEAMKNTDKEMEVHNAYAYIINVLQITNYNF